MERYPGYPIAVWGNASCFRKEKALSYDSCCATGHLRLFDTLFAECRNPWRCGPRSCRAAEFKPCCRDNHPLRTVRSHRCLLGCENKKWQEFLRVFRLTRGCVHCMGRVDVEMARTMIGYQQCAAGKAVAAFNMVVASAVSTVAAFPLQSYALEAREFAKIRSKQM